MITRLYPRVSARIWLCAAVAALGLTAVSMRLPLPVHAQAAQARRTQEALPADSVAVVGTVESVATVHVDVTPKHVLNTINPDAATGAWMDDLSKTHGNYDAEFPVTRKEHLSIVANVLCSLFGPNAIIHFFVSTPLHRSGTELLFDRNATPNSYSKHLNRSWRRRNVIY
jgi:hypothetical protein